jgi:hypothetical protein
MKEGPWRIDSDSDGHEVQDFKKPCREYYWLVKWSSRAVPTLLSNCLPPSSGCRCNTQDNMTPYSRRLLFLLRALGILNPAFIAVFTAAFTLTASVFQIHFNIILSSSCPSLHSRFASKPCVQFSYLHCKLHRCRDSISFKTQTPAFGSFSIHSSSFIPPVAAKHTHTHRQRRKRIQKHFYETHRLWAQTHRQYPAEIREIVIGRLKQRTNEPTVGALYH